VTAAWWTVELENGDQSKTPVLSHPISAIPGWEQGEIRCLGTRVDLANTRGATPFRPAHGDDCKIQKSPPVKQRTLVDHCQSHSCENGRDPPILSAQVTVASPGTPTAPGISRPVRRPTPRTIRCLRCCPLPTPRGLSVARFCSYYSGSQSFSDRAAPADQCGVHVRRTIHRFGQPVKTVRVPRRFPPPSCVGPIRQAC
jgi:hypothetical protein